MARRERRIERLRRSQTDVSPEQLQAARESVGFELASIVGSHWHYRHRSRAGKLTIPYRRPMLPVYVRNALKAIDEVTKDDRN